MELQLHKREINGLDGRVYLPTGLDPQDGAMLAALYSRSADSVEKHIERVRAAGSGKFISKWFVGFGDQSIGDNGSITVFIEDISIIAAKAIEHWLLFNGIEPSSRYIDMSSRGMVIPPELSAYRTASVDRLVNYAADLTQMYTKAVEQGVADTRRKHPRTEDTTEAEYEAAIHAWVFDRARGLLPAGTRTCVAWHSTLRQMGAQLFWLLNHPLVEVRKIATTLLGLCRDVYPDTFTTKSNPRAEDWGKTLNFVLQYQDCASRTTTVNVSLTEYGKTMLPMLKLHLADRPRKVQLPPEFSLMGTVEAGGMLDYGSFRDLQRHRQFCPAVPLLSTRLGVAPFYANGLPSEAVLLMNSMPDEVHVDALYKQYFTPMAYQVPVRAVYTIPGFIHLVELRSWAGSHDTLRKLVQDWAYAAKGQLPIPLHVDIRPSTFNVQRGKQTIRLKDLL